MRAAERWASSLDQHTARVEVLERAVLALLDGALDRVLRERAGRAAHALASSLGPFGLVSGTRLARSLEQSFGAHHTLSRALAPRLADQVQALRQELERPRAFDEIAASHQPRRRVLLITDDSDRADHYAADGAARGLDVDVAPFEAGIRAIASAPADALVIELPDDGAPDGIALLRELTQLASRPPALVVSSGDSMPLRLAIAHAGASGPVPVSHATADVLEHLGQLLDAPRNDGGSILVLDGEPDGLRASLTLERDGHTVHALTDPAAFWETLDSLSPDLVVVRSAIPPVSGIEICRALRADPRWCELPIIMLADGDGPEVERDAYLAGADDVVRSPVHTHDVSARIRNRLHRSRLQRHATDADMLTGLANRRKAERDLHRFLRLARRHRHEVSLVVFRLDRLAAVAARHGQAAADQAMRWFSHLLRRSFRAEDIVSRWGADDFAVGLFDAGGKDAVARAHEVMAALRDHRFPSPMSESPAITCSVGVATFPDDGTDAPTLYAGADAALVAARAANPVEAIGVASDPYRRVNGRVDVALVDDDPAVAALVIHALESHQYSVSWLRDGQAAAALLGEAPELRARLVLMEVNLPVFDGLTILRALGEQGKLRHTRVVLLTVRSTEAEVVQAFELGAFDHIAKPFSVSILVERVRKALTS